MDAAHIEQCRVSQHGSRQLELELQYPLCATSRHSQFRVNCYIFCPYQLGMVTDRVDVAQVLADTSIYTRFATPALSLMQICDPECEFSPIARLRGMLVQAQGIGTQSDAAIYELRLLAMMVQRQISLRRRHIGRAMAAGAPRQDIDALCATLCQDVQMLLACFRGEVRTRLLSEATPETLHQAVKWCDEYLSLSVERQFIKILRKSALRWPEVAIRHEMSVIVIREDRYRRERNYACVFGPDDVANERAIYHIGMMKKWASGCLHMRHANHVLTHHMTQLGMSTAAAVAMAFAVACTILVSQWFPINSLQWALALVVMYVFKDRIKESLRRLFLLIVPRLVADHAECLIDPKRGRRVGTERLRVRVASSRHMPESIRRLRYSSTNVFRTMLPPEDVIHLHRNVRVHSRYLRRAYSRFEGITEIIRLDLHRFLRRMDDPSDTVFFVQENEITSRRADRVYHLTCIVSVERVKKKAEAVLHYYRVVLSRVGIVRIEAIRSVQGHISRSHQSLDA